jgi:Protein of unknown function (DUF2992)
VSAVFTVFHDGHFWVGVLELHADDGGRAARHVFGPEPGNAELAEFCAGPGYAALSRAAAAAPPVPDAERPTPRRTPAGWPGGPGAHRRTSGSAPPPSARCRSRSSSGSGRTRPPQNAGWPPRPSNAGHWPAPEPAPATGAADRRTPRTERLHRPAVLFTASPEAVKRTGPL